MPHFFSYTLIVGELCLNEKQLIIDYWITLTLLFNPSFTLITIIKNIYDNFAYGCPIDLE